MLPSLPSTHVVVTFSKTRHFITARENMALKNQPNGVLVQLGESTINTSSIAEILSLEDFYRSHPDERPAEPPQEFKVPREEYVPLDRQAERSKGRMGSLVRGLREYCSTPASGPNSKAMLAKAEMRYQELYGSPVVLVPGSEDQRPEGTNSESLPTAEAWG